MSEMTTLNLTQQAVHNIHKMNDHVRHILAEEGPTERYAKAAGSLARSLTAMIGLGGRITADGDLSLYCMNDRIHYGVNYDRHSDTWSVNS